jgi:hypothetical protein
MEAARTIREAVQVVSQLRQAQAREPELGRSVADVKRLQARRFAGLYADLLRDPTYSAAASFFLEELYGVKDFADRDAQFARIAGAIEKMFPSQVAATAASLASLHALTEDLDDQLARLWSAPADSASPGLRYVHAWRLLSRPQQRRQQLESVLSLGHELARLTRTPGLRTMLRMMRGPAQAAGLGALQSFLEKGFDTFAGMARRPGAVERFLDTVRERESALLRLLDEGEAVASGTELDRILGQAP